MMLCRIVNTTVKRHIHTSVKSTGTSIPSLQALRKERHNVQITGVTSSYEYISHQQHCSSRKIRFFSSTSNGSTWNWTQTQSTSSSTSESNNGSKEISESENGTNIDPAVQTEITDKCASLHSSVMPLNEKLRGPLAKNSDKGTSLPFVFLVGNHSSGKSSFINYVLGRNVQTAGVAPTDDCFTVIAPGPADTGKFKILLSLKEQKQGILLRLYIHQK